MLSAGIGLANVGTLCFGKEKTALQEVLGGSVLFFFRLHGASLAVEFFLTMPVRASAAQDLRNQNDKPQRERRVVAPTVMDKMSL